MTEKSKKKHPCPDCKFCQWCDDSKCRKCRPQSKCPEKKETPNNPLVLNINYSQSVKK